MSRTSIREAVGGLHPRLRRFYLSRMVFVSAATLILAAGYLVLRLPTMGANLVLMVMVVVTMASSPLLIDRFGERIVLYVALLGDIVFGFGAVMITPFLIPLVVLLMLIPLMVAFPHLERREYQITLASVAITTPVLCAVAEWRRDHVEPLPTWIESGALAIFVPIVVVGIAAAVADNYRELRAQTVELKRSRTELAAAGNRARRDLERNLHDGAQQRLIALTVQLSRARALTSRGRLEDAERVIGDAIDQTTLAVEQLRELARGIYPPLLSERGLVVALNAVARDCPVPCRVVAEGVGRYSQQVEAATYFAILEALQNLAKHSAASQAEIRLWEGPGLRFEVHDNGRGFDPADVPHGTGVHGIVGRIVAAGGTAEVVSRIGEGTRVHGSFPA